MVEKSSSGMTLDGNTRRPCRFRTNAFMTDPLWPKGRSEGWGAERPPLDGVELARRTEEPRRGFAAIDRDPVHHPRPPPSAEPGPAVGGRSHVQAAVDAPHLAGDVRRGVRRQEVHHPGHLLGLSEPPERDLRPQAVEDLLGD